MSEQEQDGATLSTSNGSPVEVDVDLPIEGEDALGDPGKKALSALKEQVRTLKAEVATRLAAGGDEKAVLHLAQERKNAEKVRQELEELRTFKAKAEGTEAEYQASQEAQRIQEEALGKANKRILRSELKALATGKLADPGDAHLYIDLEEFTVSDDGDVDSGGLAEAITELLTQKPHLSASPETRFQGAGDGGAGAEPKPNESLDDAIAAARAARNFPLVASLLTQKAAEAKKG